MGKQTYRGLVTCGVVPRARLRFMDRNTELKPVSPVVWFCSATFSWSSADREVWSAQGWGCRVMMVKGDRDTDVEGCEKEIIS